MSFGTANIDDNLRIHFSILLSDSPLYIFSFVLCVRLVDSCRLRLYFFYIARLCYSLAVYINIIFGYSKLDQKSK